MPALWEKIADSLIGAVLFDYGGTLVRPKRPWEEIKADAIRAEYKVLRRHGLKQSFDQYKVLDEAIFQKYAELEEESGRDIPDITKSREVVDNLFPSRLASWRARVAAEANDTFWRVTKRNFPLREGAAVSLAQLRSMKLGMGVVSNHHNAESLVSHLNELHISRYFSHVLASCQVGFRKPDPRIFERSLSLLKVSKEEAVYVGDSPEFDVEGARRTGMRSVLIVDDYEQTLPKSGQEVRRGKYAADFVIRNLAEIPRIIPLL